MSLKDKILYDSSYQISILILLLAIYLVTKSSVIALLGGLYILIIFLADIYSGVKKHGWKEEAKEVAVVLLVVLLFWFGLKFALSSQSPISAVVSCSMLPVISRGDLIVVQGEEDYDAPLVFSLTPDEFSQINNSKVLVRYENKSFYVYGSLFSYCQQSKDPICYSFYLNPEKFEEVRGPLAFKYSQCIRKYSNSSEVREVCVREVVFKGKTYRLDKTGDVIVYNPPSWTLFGQLGSIVHRALIKLNVSGDVYYLTKGDNNNVFDIQYYSYSLKLANHPVPEDWVEGKVIFTIPYLGYYKLFLSMYVKEMAQCETVLVD